MQILQFLASLFSNNQLLSALTPIFKALIDNNFDLNKVFSSIDLTALAPLFNFESDNIKNPTEEFSVGENLGLSPISDLADSKIIYSLNKYLA